MSRTVRYGLCLVALLAVAALIPTITAPAKTAPGPYASALSNLTVGQTYAASNCNNKDCAGGSRHNIVCAKVMIPGTNCFNYQGFCISQACQ